jgi:hypothetical protein
MTLEELAYLSQIIGVFAVCGSLVFVGLQMRAQARESRLAAIQELCTQYQGLMTSMINNKDLSRAWLHALRDGLSAVAEEEEIQLTAVIQQYLRTFESLFIQHRARRLDDDMWQAMKKQFAAYMSTSPFRDVWAIRAHFFTPQFQALINSLPTATFPLVTRANAANAPEPMP